MYVHVPFCSTRCGYCDFNTYTATELGDSVRRDRFHEVLCAEIAAAARTPAGAEGTIDTVFIGGGTPTLLGADGLASILDAIRREFGLSEGAEVTTEANPDSVDPPMLESLRAAGFTRLSLGMQSSASGVLRTLDRTHTPGSSTRAAAAAIRAGFDHVNLDLIYGTPGETDDDVRRSVQDAIDAGVDHVSAYSLIVEDGTPLARRVRRGEIPMPDDDVAADRYEIVDDMLSEAGMPWYEISNWARPGGECRHNLGYWRGGQWWGIGPGAHSHVDGVRWWNVKHPRTYAERLASGASPEEDREELTDEQRRTETVMLALRTRAGLSAAGRDAAVPALVAEGLIDPAELDADRLVLTRSGRLVADGVVRRILAGT